MTCHPYEELTNAISLREDDRSNMGDILSDPRLSIIIPAYNESKRIEKTLTDLDRYLKTHSINAEILVVDDGSIDNTTQIANNLNLSNLRVLQNNKNMGKGFTVRQGFAKADGDYILFMDADGATHLNAIKEFLAEMKNNFDLLIGSRYLVNSVVPIPQTKWRQLTANISRLMIKTFFLFPYKDTQCGFKMMTKKSAEVVLPKMQENGFLFDVEMIYLAREMGLRVKEIPVTWSDKAGSTITFFKGPVMMTWRLIVFRVKTFLNLL